MAAEKDFENQIKKWLHSVGVYPAGYPASKMEVPITGWYTKVWGGGFQKAGVPDLLCCVEGVFLAIEVKAENGYPSSLQTLNIERIRKGGGLSIILYPSEFETFKDNLKFLIDDREKRKGKS